MKSMQERLKDFLKRNGLTILHIQEMINLYARSEKDLARSHFSKQYGITPSIFYKCRDFAIICWLVDDYTCNKLKAKATSNYRAHNPKGTATASLAHFDELFKQRKEFLNSIPSTTILEIANEYSKGKSSAELAYEYSKTSSFIVEAISRGIKELLLDKKMVDEIVSFVPDYPEYSHEKSVIANALMDREETKKAFLHHQKSEIMALRFKISNYDTFYMFDILRPELSDLQKELDDCKERYLKFQNL